MSRLRLTALFLMIAGFAWTAGNFVQPDKPLGLHVLTTLLHALPVALTILLALPLVERRDGGPRWALRGITALALLYAFAIVDIIAYSVVNPDPNAFGIHSLGDAEAAAVVSAGNLLWLASLRPARAARNSRQEPAALRTTRNPL
jgi:hypothetical protein